MKKKSALITGINGQDGSYLAEFLIKKNYFVHGISSKKKSLYINSKNIKIHKGKITNFNFLKKIINKTKPDEIYHLAAKSFVSYDFVNESKSFNTNINSTHIILSLIKNLSMKSKFYFAASSEVFGNTQKTPQNEFTRFEPRSAYGISKMAGYQLTKFFRETYKIFACSGILYNHESPRRGLEFVTRKITNSAAKIKLGMQKKIFLGNIMSKRDWGYAPDYVEAMWLMLQQKKPDDYIIGTGKLHAVKDLLKIAFNYVGLDYKKYLVIKKNLFRPSDSILLKANFKKANSKLKWNPKTNLKKIIETMVKEDLNNLRK